MSTHARLFLFSSVASFSAVVLLALSCLSGPKRPDPILTELRALNATLTAQTELLEKISSYTHDGTACLVFMIKQAQANQPQLRRSSGQ